VAQERTEALVLRGVDFGETSRIVTLLTPQRGQVAVLAKGARRKNSATGPALDTFNLVEAVVYWKDGRGIQNLGEVSLIDRHGGLKRDLARGAYGAFVLELAGKTCPENAPSEALFRRVGRALDDLDRTDRDLRTVACGHALALLDTAGYRLTADGCARCGAPLGDRPGFTASEGLLCGRCPGEHGLDPAVPAALAAQVGGMRPEDLDPGVFTLVGRFAAWHLETELKSLRVLERMLV